MCRSQFRFNKMWQKRRRKKIWRRSGRRGSWTNERLQILKLSTQISLSSISISFYFETLLRARSFTHTQTYTQTRALVVNRFHIVASVFWLIVVVVVISARIHIGTHFMYLYLRTPSWISPCLSFSFSFSCSFWLSFALTDHFNQFLFLSHLFPLWWQQFPTFS